LKKAEETAVEQPIMATKKSGKGPLGKNGQAWTERQKKLVEHIPTSKSHGEAAVKAGYPSKNAAQSAHQALRQMRGRVPDLMDQLGISERELIDKHLCRQLTAQRTIFAQKDGKFRDKRTVDALEIQIRAFDLAFQLHGSYAPRDPKEAAQFGVKVIVNDMPRPHCPTVDVAAYLASQHLRDGYKKETPGLEKKANPNGSDDPRPKD
jgi:hypothetical protein